MDLPVELRLNIFEKLDFINLIRVSRAVPQSRNLIENVFQNILKNREFRVHFDQYSKKIEISYDSTVVERIAYEDINENFEEILDFFKYFGHSITKLWYKYDSSVHSLCEQVHKQIGKYVAGSVIKIIFDLGNEPINGSLNELVVPYPKCKIARIWFSEIEAETLCHMFPAVQNFDLSFIELNGSLSCFPYLESLDPPLYWLKNKSHLPHFKETLELNPQLKHLFMVRHDDWDILKTLNEIRPDFESLEIWGLDFSPLDVPLRFANMKVFKCRMGSSIERELINRIPLEFGNLEEIEFESKELTGHWIDILMQNKKLKKVHSVNALDRENLGRIVSGLPNLEEFEMECHKSEPQPIHVIVKLLQSAKKLKKINFSRVEKNDCHKAAHQLINDWEIVDDKFKCCCFVRKSFD